MIRHVVDFGSEYFVERFRRSALFQDQEIIAPDVSSKPEQRFISICTTCMNRLADLKKTLPCNIDCNEKYSRLEFILLDYGSTDGLGDWVRKNMKLHLESGRLIYYWTKQNRFRPNHSRNVSFRLARGEVVTNVDADNFTHERFVERINQCASVAQEKLLIVPNSFLRIGSDRLNLRGRFALFRKDIIALGGFDEELDDGYSQDDVNFVLRAHLSGCKKVRFEDSFLDGRLETPFRERTRFCRIDDFEMGKKRNARITAEKLVRCETVANRNQHWGKASLIRNFSNHVSV
jgi:glycosyltransferase involved in cell wall biosynthesis